MKLVILGAPGAGKGTQAEQLEAYLRVPTISTGMMVRKAIREQTEFGKLSKAYIDDGQLVPDDAMIKVLDERLRKKDCRHGFILDGYPRTVHQAKDLENKGIIIDKVLSVEVPDELIVERLSGRLECGNCGASYHVKYRAPMEEGICDVCDSPLIRRDDDIPEIILKRLAAYHEKTAPLKEYYAKQGKLCVAEGQGDIKDTINEVFKVLELGVTD
ncbi:MAG: adenylate kinase [Oscillospiraceae bacterium]|nr:adenylate kinase [Oscillospiraceae bacterium]